ncbi:hypothetical protein ACFVU3_32150 [Streptomyces sp. NPDC058052]|uniref:hypothetical protein n=1 Tax=Streptomyces sp. NPDC058052 TaxID=3346316 RepID=UPI0036EB6303
MLVRPAVSGLAAMALCAAALLTGCSGGAPAEAVGTEEEGYYRCLEANGLVLEKRDDGQLRVDKDANELAAMTEAEAKCRDKLPTGAPRSTATVPAAFLAKSQKLSACVRENGYPEYPDPDPATGEANLTNEQKAQYHTPEFQAAWAKCAGAEGATGDVVGG